jgi:hypothetical protein
MFNRKLTTTLALLAATAGISTFAATANAVVVDNDNAGLDGPEVDLTDANLAFDRSNGVTTPKLTGDLEATNAGDTRVRVRVTSFNNGDVLNTEYGNAMDVPDDDFISWNVNRPGIGDPLTDEVVVAVEKESLLNGWETQAERTLPMNTFTDSFKVLDQGIDIGGLGYSGGVPTSDASVWWSIDEGLVTPVFNDMRLHLDNFGADCGRIKVRYLTDTGDFLDDGKSTRRCPNDNGHYSWAADIPPYTSSLLGKVEVIAQSHSGGAWGDADSVTLSIAEDE